MNTDVFDSFEQNQRRRCQRQRQRCRECRNNPPEIPQWAVLLIVLLTIVACAIYVSSSFNSSLSNLDHKLDLNQAHQTNQMNEMNHSLQQINESVREVVSTLQEQRMSALESQTAEHKYELQQMRFEMEKIKEKRYNNKSINLLINGIGNLILDWNEDDDIHHR